jgi:hypothetical protein
VRRRVLGLLALLAATGCNPLVQVRIDEPASAAVVIEEGYDLPAIKTRIPFKGFFEAVSNRESDAYRLTFNLDEQLAARFGGHGAVVLHGKLCLDKPSKSEASDSIVIKLDEAQLRELIEGKRSQVEMVFPSNVDPSKKRGRLILRTRDD